MIMYEGYGHRSEYFAISNKIFQTIRRMQKVKAKLLLFTFTLLTIRHFTLLCQIKNLRFCNLKTNAIFCEVVYSAILSNLQSKQMLQNSSTNNFQIRTWEVVAK